MKNKSMALNQPIKEESMEKTSTLHRGFLSIEMMGILAIVAVIIVLAVGAVSIMFNKSTVNDELSNSHVAGTHCTTTGDISRDEHGGLLSCQQGVWSGAESYPVGSPIPWPSAIIPQGYLACDGHTFNKSSYPKLARAYPSGILPDLRGVFLRGWDAGRGLDYGRQLLGYQNDENGMVLGGGELHGHHNGMEHWTRNRSQEVRPKNVAFYYIVKAE